MTTLYVQDSGEFREASQQIVLDCAHKLIAHRFRRGAHVLKNPAATRAFLQIHLGAREHEVFGVLYLDTHRRLIEAEDLFRGTIDSAAIYPREILRRVLEQNASAIICYHNHPSSGVVEPSHADELITRRIQQVVSLIDVQLLDHWVVGNGCYSFADNGRL